MALGAMATYGIEVDIVPCGLTYYNVKQIFFILNLF